jgi:hypothetical protein
MHTRGLVGRWARMRWSGYGKLDGNAGGRDRNEDLSRNHPAMSVSTWLGTVGLRGLGDLLDERSGVNLLYCPRIYLSPNLPEFTCISWFVDSFTVFRKRCC